MGDSPKKNSGILTELGHHFPFTILSAIFAVCTMALLTEILPVDAEIAGLDTEAVCTDPTHDHGAADGGADAGHDHEHGSVFDNLFHVFHPIHILLSAMATSAMFWRFEKKLWKAVLVGLVGSLGVCGVSDIVMPFAGGRLLGTDMHFHFCLIENPSLIVPFALLGVLVGLLSSRAMPGRGATIFSHSAHVVISTMASLLYLIAFGFHGWMVALFHTFVLLILAVLIPCCLSDIFFPLLMVEKGRILHDHEGHSHCVH